MFRSLLALICTSVIAATPVIERPLESKSPRVTEWAPFVVRLQRTRSLHPKTEPSENQSEWFHFHALVAKRATEIAVFFDEKKLPNRVHLTLSDTSQTLAPFYRWGSENKTLRYSTDHVRPVQTLQFSFTNIDGGHGLWDILSEPEVSLLVGEIEDGKLSIDLHTPEQKIRIHLY